MAHYGMLGSFQFADDVDDIRGADVHDRNTVKIGTVKDVIFDHASGNIRYLVVKGAEDHTFLVSPEQVHPDPANDDNFILDLDKRQVAALPRFDEKILKQDNDWKEHEEQHRKMAAEWRKQQEKTYKERWEEDGGVAHKKGSSHVITPEPGEMPAPGPGGAAETAEFDLTPRRIAPVFSDTAPPGGKINLRPDVVAKEEDTKYPGVARRVTGEDDPDLRRVEHALDEHAKQGPDDLSTPTHPRWRTFELTLQKRRSDIVGQCGVCGGERAA